MSIPKPSLSSRCCCAGAGAVAGAGAAPGAPFDLARYRASLPAGSSAAPSSGPLAWRRSPAAGVLSRVPPALYAALTRASTEPVRVLSLCGRDRDCVSDERIVDSFNTARRNGFAWIGKGLSRTVDIFSQPANVLLAHMIGSDAAYVEFTPNSRDETEMRAIQNSPHAGRFGFLPD